MNGEVLSNRQDLQCVDQNIVDNLKHTLYHRILKELEMIFSNKLSHQIHDIQNCVNSFPSFVILTLSTLNEATYVSITLKNK